MKSGNKNAAIPTSDKGISDIRSGEGIRKMAKRTIGLMNGDRYFKDNLPIYVNRAVESFDLHEHRHDFLEISYVSEGSGVHHTSQASVSVSQGDLVLLPVGVSHVFRPLSASKSRPLVVRNCLIQTERFASLLGDLPGCGALSPLLTQPDIRYYRDRDGECGRLFQRLHHEYGASRPAREAALYMLLLELLILLHRLEEEQAADTAKPLAGMEEALRLLHADYAAPLSTAALAACAGIGERQFLRVFGKYTGMTPLAYQQTLRMQEACRLLRDTDWKLAAIAAATGYQDMSHFAALFKRIVGCAPGRYRKQSRSGLSAGDAGGADLPT